MKSILAKDLKDLLGNIELIDVREVNEYVAGHPRGSVNHPVSDILANYASILDKSKTYYISCLSGGRSSMVCSNLSMMGYDVINVTGGFMAFAAALPEDVEK